MKTVGQNGLIISFQTFADFVNTLSSKGTTFQIECCPTGEPESSKGTTFQIETTITEIVLLARSRGDPLVTPS